MRAEEENDFSAQLSHNSIVMLHEAAENPFSTRKRFVYERFDEPSVRVK